MLSVNPPSAAAACKAACRAAAAFCFCSGVLACCTLTVSCCISWGSSAESRPCEVEAVCTGGASGGGIGGICAGGDGGCLAGKGSITWLRCLQSPMSVPEPW